MKKGNLSKEKLQNEVKTNILQLNKEKLTPFINMNNMDECNHSVKIALEDLKQYHKVASS